MAEPNEIIRKQLNAQRHLFSHKHCIYSAKGKSLQQINPLNPSPEIHGDCQQRGQFSPVFGLIGNSSCTD
jgi:hypothetical protein